MDSIQRKMAFVAKIKEKKAIVEGKFSNQITKETKNAAWEELLQFAKSIGLVPNNFTKDKLRDQTWGNWKRRAKEKLDKSRSTGSGKVKLTELDNAVLDILGRDTPGVSGLNISDDSSIEEEFVPTATARDEATGSQQLSNRVSTHKAEKTGCNLGKRSSKFSEEEDDLLLNKRKKNAQIEYIKASTELVLAQKYKTQLECLALERQLQLPPSEVTSCLPKSEENPPQTFERIFTEL